MKGPNLNSISLSMMKEQLRMFKTIIMIVWAFSLHAHNAINKAFHAINKA
jgi:hypothetical protein